MIAASKKATTLLVALLGAALIVQAHDTPEWADLVACETDADCRDALPEVESGCSPLGFCTDAGATCSSDEDCYDACGTTGICGGVGAACDTILYDNYIGIKCMTGFTCTGDFEENGTATGVCIAGDGPVPSAYRHRRSHQLALSRRCPAGHQHCGGSGSSNSRELLSLSDQDACINTQDNIEFCGGCVSDGRGRDCSSIENSDEVACSAGKCTVLSCAEGYSVSEDATACL